MFNTFVFQPLNLCDIEELSSIAVSKEDEVNRRVDIQVKDPNKEVSGVVVVAVVVLYIYLWLRWWW